MRTRNAVLLASAIALSSCASTPTIVTSPPPPPRPLPSALKDSPALTETPLNERVEALLKDFADSLTKARR